MLKFHECISMYHSALFLGLKWLYHCPHFCRLNPVSFLKNPIEINL